MSNIRIFTTAAAQIIGDLQKVEGDTYVLNKAMGMQIQQQRNAEGAVVGVEVGFLSLAPFASETDEKKIYTDLELPKYGVFFSYEPNADIISEYTDITSTIILASNKIIS